MCCPATANRAATNAGNCRQRGYIWECHAGLLHGDVGLSTFKDRFTFFDKGAHTFFCILTFQHRPVCWQSPLRIMSKAVGRGWESICRSTSLWIAQQVAHTRQFIRPFACCFHQFARRDDFIYQPVMRGFACGMRRPNKSISIAILCGINRVDAGLPESG